MANSISINVIIENFVPYLSPFLTYEIVIVDLDTFSQCHRIQQWQCGCSIENINIYKSRLYELCATLTVFMILTFLILEDLVQMQRIEHSMENT